MNTAHTLFGCSTHWHRPVSRVVLLCAFWGLAIAAAAAEVKVLSAEAFAPVVAAMAPVFEKRTGDKLVMVTDNDAGVAKRIRGGQDFDLAVLPPEVLEALGKEGAIYAGSIVSLAKVVTGTQNGTVYAGALSDWASDSQSALSLLILLASEETQAKLKDKGMAAP
jgi:ABC-type molybdate transport system substrate-binding protein